MHLTVIHDEEGNILGATAHPAGTPPSGPRLEPGQYATEIEASGIDAGLDPDAVFERVSKIVEENQVIVKDGKGSLKGKSRAGRG
jgi:hypothetical protein